MIALIIYLLIGAGLFIFLVALARRKGAPVEGCGQEFVEARHALLTLRSGLLPASLLERIFGRGDLEYVTAETPPEIRKLFLAERKRISLIWARRMRLEIRNLMRFHLGYSRFQAKMSLDTELRLALDFVGFCWHAGCCRSCFSPEVPTARRPGRVAVGAAARGQNFGKIAGIPEPSDKRNSLQ